MRRRQHSRAGLFLIELMIAIAFFAVTAAVFLQAFARSHSISRQAEELFRAQSMASSVAEILYDAADGQEAFLSALSAYFPAARQMETGEGVCVYFDAEWEACAADEGAYVAAVSWQEEPVSGLWRVEITVDEAEKPADGQYIYRLALKLYDPQEGGTA